MKALCAEDSELTVGAHHSKSAFHVNSKVQIPEQNRPQRVAKLHIIESRMGGDTRSAAGKLKMYSTSSA